MTEPRNTTDNPSHRTIGGSLRTWIKSKPHAAAFRLDAERIVKVSTRTNRWSEAQKAIEVLGAQTIEALDSSGAVLRVTEIEGDWQDAPAAMQPPQKEAWPDDKESRMAMIITAACDRAASRSEAAFRFAFEKYDSLVMVLAARLTGLEEAYAAEIHAQRQALEVERAGSSEQASTAMMGQVLQGAVLRMTGPAKRTRPNGVPSKPAPPVASAPIVEE